jgi:hypothetical protein
VLVLLYVCSVQSLYAWQHDAKAVFMHLQNKLTLSGIHFHMLQLHGSEISVHKPLNAIVSHGICRSPISLVFRMHSVAIASHRHSPSSSFSCGLEGFCNIRCNAYTLCCGASRAKRQVWWQHNFVRGPSNRALRGLWHAFCLVEGAYAQLEQD